MQERDKTRRERYEEKKTSAKFYPFSLATVNFRFDVNVAHVVRSAACFGASEVVVVGKCPGRRLMNSLSGSLYDYTKVLQVPTPHAFLEYMRQNETDIVSIELPSNNFPAVSLWDYKFENKKTCIIVGHETSGIPPEILMHSKSVVYIPMYGFGHCLNTSQASNIALHEAVRQYELGRYDNNICKI